MKTLVFAFLAIIFVSCVSAISSDLSDRYEQSETVIITFSGNILTTPSAEQVEIRRGGVKVPVEYDLVKLGEKYYLWFIAPENEANYTLIVKDIEAIVDGNSVKQTYQQNFSVSGNRTDYYISPGAIFTRDSFSIDVRLNGEDIIALPIDFPYAREVYISPGRTELVFPIDSISGTIEGKIRVGKYAVPIYIISNRTSSQVKRYLRFEPDGFEKVVLVSVKSEPYKFRIYNDRETIIPNVTLNYDKTYLVVNPERFSEVPGKGYIEFNVSLKKPSVGNLSEKIVANYEGTSVDLPLFFIQTNNESYYNEALTPRNGSSVLPYCSEVPGIICTAGEVCSGNIITSRDGQCCTGTCSQITPPGSSRAWIGYLIASVVLISGIYIYFRYQKTKRPGDALSKRIKEAEKHIP